VHHGVVVQLDQPGGRTYKEAGPEGSVQLRNLTVVERASEQLLAECFRFGVRQIQQAPTLPQT
jgi:hypothetical protein